MSKILFIYYSENAQARVLLRFDDQNISQIFFKYRHSEAIGNTAHDNGNTSSDISGDFVFTEQMNCQVIFCSQRRSNTFS